LAAAESVSGDVVVWNGDNVGAVDRSGLLDHHRDAGAAATLPIDEVSRECGVRAGRPGASGRGREARGVAYALVGREATARLQALPRWRSVSRVEWGILALAVGGLALTLVSFVDPPARASVVGHTTGLVVGVGGGVRVGWLEVGRHSGSRWYRSLGNADCP
jgi:hypothetical protein